MSEQALLWWNLPRFALVGLFGVLYSRGGINHRWIRWGLGGLLLAVGVTGFALVSHSVHWWFWLSVIWYPFTLHVMGYGVNTDDAWDDLWRKVRRRALYGLALGGCSILFVYSLHTAQLAMLQVGIAVLVNVVLGVWNPVNAREEEFLIGSLSVVLVPWMI